ncbi:MAG TPA: tRNA lysidine(34) synthetase TilS, partial [Dehalococcoidia bacterium]|nr:tRNA lysidine(34) synthetase TilS [Dehalococcoidia bacterium]
MTNDALRLRRRIESKLRRHVSDNGVLDGDGRLLLAVSGGSDSTALLLLLLELTKRRPGRIAVAHFDHALRGAAASKRDAAFVRELAQSCGVPFYSRRGDVRARAKTDRISIEEAARRERYEFLARAAREAGCDAVATGHTASDQAETVLLHILRGAGLEGLAAMSPRAAWPFAGQEGLSLLRPLLWLTGAETRAYCGAAGVTPIEDESNV